MDRRARQRTYLRTYREKHAEELREQARLHREENGEEIRERERLARAAAGAAVFAPRPERERRNAAVVSDYLAGGTPREIGEEHGIATKHVHGIVRAAGVSRPTSQPERDTAIVLDYLAGLPLREIAEKYAVSPQHVANTASKAGAPARIPRYTDEELLAALRTAVQHPDGRLSWNEYDEAWRRLGLPSINCFGERFGSWVEACRRAGLESVTQPKAERDERNAAIAADYLAGLPLGEIGEKYGLSANRVSKIASLEGCPSRPRIGVPAGPRRPRARANEARDEAIVADYRDGMPLRDMEKKYGIGIKRFREIGRAAGLPPRRPMPPPKGRRPDSKGGSRGNRYSDDDLLAAVREVADCNDGYVSVRIYREAYEILPGLPSLPLLLNRFPSWVAMCALAGVKCGVRNPNIKYDRISRDECIEALRTVAEGVGRLPSMGQYEEVRQATGKQLPSIALIRKRLGGWNAAIQALEASEELAA